MHLKIVKVFFFFAKQIVKVKQITKPKKEVLDNKQAFMWVVDTHRNPLAK